MSGPVNIEPVNIERQEGFCDYIERMLDSVVGFPESVKGLLDSHRAALAELHRWRDPESAERREARRDQVEWRCDNCGNAYPDGPGTWRHGFHGPEHACADRHPQAGHASATYVGEDVTRSALVQLRADMVRANTDLTAARERIAVLEDVLDLYACAGHARCTQPKLKDGSCAADHGHGACGDHARRALNPEETK